MSNRLCLTLFALSQAFAITHAASAQTITFAGDRGTSCTTFVGTTGGVHTITVTGANVIAGQTLILTIGTTANATLLTGTDDAGNGYNGLTTLPGVVGRVSNWGGTLSTQLSVGQNVTLTYTTSTAGEISCASIHAFNNVAPLTGSVDVFGSASGTSTSPGVVLGSSTTQPNELLVETHIVNGVTGGNSTGPGDSPLQQVSSGNFSVIPSYRIVSATGTLGITGNLVNSLPWQAVMTAIKDVVAPVELQRFNFE